MLALAIAVGALGAAAVWRADRTAELWVDMWSRIGVPALLPTFADTRAFTSAWECSRLGYDVFAENPCDPWNRTLVPPGFLVRLDFLGLGPSATVPLALAMIALFAVSVLVVAGPVTWRQTLVYLAILFSPSVLLGVERGNTDLLVFSLLTLVLVTVRSPSRWWRATAYAALLLASLIKVYPIFAAGLLLRQSPRRALAGGAAVFLPLAVYAVFTFDELTSSMEGMTRLADLSWGASVAPEALGLSDRSTTIVVVAGVAAGLALSVGLALALRGREAWGGEDERRLDAFWIGAGVYVGTFVVGSNFNYKLVCLIFTVPQLLAWSSRAHARMPFAGLALAAVVATFWVGVERPFSPGIGDLWLDALRFFPFDEILTWGLFVYLATALWLTVPSWLSPSWTAVGAGGGAVRARG